MSYFFNGDFEDFLASDDILYTIKSSKKNQEFEYLIFWLENEALFTEKNYDPDYLSFVATIKKHDLTIEKDKARAIPWCSSVKNKQLAAKLNSKMTSAEFGLKHKLVHEQTRLCHQGDQIREDRIYKDPFGVSGNGIWKGQMHQDKIKKILERTDLIEEPLLARQFDFSACVTQEKTYFYQNYVDEYFQYKGSLLGINFNAFEWFERYKQNIEKIKNYYFELGSNYPFSIDSFLYREDGIDKVYTLSEVNARKTMGYIAIKLWEKYMASYRYCSLRIISSKKLKQEINAFELYKNSQGKIINLSPAGNKFVTFLLAENSIHELHEMEDYLFSTLFECI